jgi:hypothetical protein
MTNPRLQGRRTTVRVGAVASLLGGLLTAASSMIHFHGIARPLVPLGVACLGVGMFGLQAAIRPRESTLRRYGLVLTVTGVSLGVIGMAGSAIGIVATPAAHLINTGEHAGLPCIGAGMLAWGFASIRARALGRWSAAPLLVGVLALAGTAALNPTALAFLERTTVLPAAFGASWVTVGLGLLAAARPPSPPIHDVAAS